MKWVLILFEWNNLGETQDYASATPFICTRLPLALCDFLLFTEVKIHLKRTFENLLGIKKNKREQLHTILKEVSEVLQPMENWLE